MNLMKYMVKALANALNFIHRTGSAGVQFISELTDTDFEKLGIEKIGWRKALKRAALKYA